MLNPPTGTPLVTPAWTPFIKEIELESQDGAQLLLKRGRDEIDYLVFPHDSDPQTRRRLYLPLGLQERDNWARPRVRETLSGSRTLISALSNSDYVFIVDEDPVTGIFLRTVVTSLHTLQESDPIIDKMPSSTDRLALPQDDIRKWLAFSPAYPAGSSTSDILPGESRT